MTPKLSIGDNVRIAKKKKTFDEGYTQRWTEEVFHSWFSLRRGVAKNFTKNVSYETNIKEKRR